MNLEGRPKNTIYINNLNEKIKKEELKRSLFALFSQFGNILDIIVMKTMKMRGQAFIVFKDIVSASNAIRSMQGFPFYDKPMRIQYSKKDSEVTLQLRGVMKGVSLIPEKQKKKHDKDLDKEGTKKKKTPKTIGLAAAPQIQASTTVENPTEKLKEDESTAPVEKVAPYKVLFLSNLPEETNEMMLSMLFNQFPGFKEVRLIPNRSDIAFVEFENEVQSGSARDALQGFKITVDKHMQIAFAKR